MGTAALQLGRSSDVYAIRGTDTQLCINHFHESLLSIDFAGWPVLCFWISDNTLISNSEFKVRTCLLYTREYALYVVENIYIDIYCTSHILHRTQ